MFRGPRVWVDPGSELCSWDSHRCCCWLVAPWRAVGLLPPPRGPNLKVDGTARTPRGQDRVCRSHSEAWDAQAIWGGLSGGRGPRFGFVMVGGQVWAQGCRAGWAMVACSPPRQWLPLGFPSCGVERGCVEGGGRGLKLSGPAPEAESGRPCRSPSLRAAVQQRLGAAVSRGRERASRCLAQCQIHRGSPRGEVTSVSLLQFRQQGHTCLSSAPSQEWACGRSVYPVVGTSPTSRGSVTIHRA